MGEFQDELEDYVGEHPDEQITKYDDKDEGDDHVEEYAGLVNFVAARSIVVAESEQEFEEYAEEVGEPVFGIIDN